MPAIAAGFISVLVGFTSSAVIIFQAAKAAGATPEQIGSWMIALAGLALLNTIANSLNNAVADTSTREAAAITFLVTASGVTLLGIGAAFWGLVAGVIAMLTMRRWDRAAN